jgi:hypothetical protein
MVALEIENSIGSINSEEENMSSGPGSHLSRSWHTGDINGIYERLLEHEMEDDEMNIFQPKINRISYSDKA